jgi:hypothetical protein
LEARAQLLVTIAIHFLLQLAHNFSFGVDFMPFATQNNGMSLLPFLLYNCFYLPWLTLTLHFSLYRLPLPSCSGTPLFFISICWFFHVMSCSQPQSSFDKMASQSKAVHGKNNSPSGFLLMQRDVPVLQVRS